VTTRDTPKYIPKGAVKGVQELVCGKAAAIFNSISICAFLVCACLLLIEFALLFTSLYNMKNYEIT
jgi:hypothetical protein